MIRKDLLIGINMVLIPTIGATAVTKTPIICFKDDDFDTLNRYTLFVIRAKYFPKIKATEWIAPEIKPKEKWNCSRRFLLMNEDS